MSVVSHELYGLMPGEFTSRRDARAAEARQSGDRDLAAAIKKLPRPTVSAWLSNLAARDRHDQVAKLLALGEAMRDAQTQLCAEKLRRLSHQRHQAVSALSADVRRLAAERGQLVSEAAARELEETLTAAVSDAAAADALRSGRLRAPLRYSGFGPVDVAGAVAVPAAPVSESARAPIAPHGDGDARSDDEDDETDAAAQDRENERLDAERALRNAQAELAEAEADAADRDRHVRDAGEQRQRCRQAVADLERQLEEHRAAEEQAAAMMHDAEEARDAAGRAVQLALGRAAEASDALRAMAAPAPGKSAP